MHLVRGWHLLCRKENTIIHIFFICFSKVVLVSWYQIVWMPKTNTFRTKNQVYSIQHTRYKVMWIVQLILCTISAIYFILFSPRSPHTQSLKYSSYSYLTTRIMLLILTLHNSTYVQESQNKYESRANTKILTRKLGVYCACCFVFLAYVSFFLRKTVNICEWFESLESHESFINTCYK